MKIQLLWIVLVMIPIAAAELCQEVLAPGEIPCAIVSTWAYDQCNITEIRVFDSEPSLLFTTNFTDYGVGGLCNVTWNITTIGSYFWNVTNGDSGNIFVQSEENEMASLSITIFILLITGVLFWLSSKKELLNNKYADFIVRRCFIVLGIFLMIFNSAIMATLAENAGLGLTQEMFFFMKLFGYIGYPAMIWLLFSTLVRSLKEWKADKTKKRMGEDSG